MISRIKVALAGFDEIYISTIHGFCYRMLLQNAFESGTEFNTVLVPNVKDIIADFVYDYWTKISCDTDEALLDALYYFCSPDDLVTLGSKIGQNDAITIAPKTKEYEPQIQAEWMRLVGEFVDAWELEKGTYLQDLLDRAENKIINGTPLNCRQSRNFSMSWNPWCCQSSSRGILSLILKTSFLPSNDSVIATWFQRFMHAKSGV